jgi:hypothetical protein
MFCKKHPDYQAKRRPKVNCFSCWRLYLEARGSAVEASIEESRRAGNDELVYWLSASIDDIIYAPLEGEVAKSAKISSGFEFLPEEKAEKEPAKNEQEPAKGVII